MDVDDRLWLRPEEAAKVLSLGRAKVYNMIAAGELPSVRIGRSIRVPAGRLREWIHHREVANDAGEKG